MTPGTPEYNARMVAIGEGRPDPTKTDPNAGPQRPDWLPEKFWNAETGQANTEALAKSYAELERSRSQQPDPKPGEADGDAQSAVQKAGLDWDVLTTKIADKGALDLDDYAKLAAAGIPKEIVDNYIEGLTVAAEARVDRTADYVAQQTGQEDGHAALEDMLTWAEGNLNKETKQYINQMLASEESWKQGLDMLGNAWLKANPMAAEGRQALGGASGGSGGVVPFETPAQQTAAINDPRYQDSPSYRQQVRARMAITQFQQ